MVTRDIQPHADADANRVYLKTPAEIAARRVQLLGDLEAGRLRSLSFGLPDIDAVISTIWPGRLMSIIARPSHGKTALLVHLARVEAQRLIAMGSGGYVLFISAEEDETDISTAITQGPAWSTVANGTAEMRAAVTNAESAVRWPVWTASYERRAVLAGADGIPPFSVEQILREVIQAERDTAARPSAIFVDYLQIMDVEGYSARDGRAEAVGQALKTLKRIAQIIGCPVVVAIQARESVDDKAQPQPEIGDCYYSSEIAHVSDVAVSLMMPFRYPPAKFAGGVIEWQGVPYAIDYQTLAVQLLKQRKDRGRAEWLCRLIPERFEVTMHPPRLTVSGRPITRGDYAD